LVITRKIQVIIPEETAFHAGVSRIEFKKSEGDGIYFIYEQGDKENSAKA